MVIRRCKTTDEYFLREAYSSIVTFGGSNSTFRMLSCVECGSKSIDIKDSYHVKRRDEPEYHEWLEGDKVLVPRRQLVIGYRCIQCGCFQIMKIELSADWKARRIHCWISEVNEYNRDELYWNVAFFDKSDMINFGEVRLPGLE